MSSFAENHTDSTSLVLACGLHIAVEQCAKNQPSAVSFSIKAGHFNDPNSLPGLAHLFEHMVFMGSEHYPQKNVLVSMLENLGGSINAWTSGELTNYHFTCPHEHLIECLSILVDMLYRPNLEQATISDEIHTIEQEYQAKVNDLGKQLLQVQRETSNPSHPFHRFSTGNASTFNRMSIEQIQVQLKQFHTTHYQASNMTLCVVDSAPAHNITRAVSELFCSVKQTASSERIPHHTPQFLDEQVGCEISILNPASEQLLIFFPLVSDNLELTHCAIDVLSAFIDHQGPHSLRQTLMNSNLISAMHINAQPQGSFSAEFSIGFQLTELGIEHRLRIAQLVIQAVQLVPKHLHETWRIQQFFALNEISATINEGSNVLEHAITRSVNMLLYPHQNGRRVSEFDSDLIPRYLKSLVSQIVSRNMRLFYLGRLAKTNRTTVWHTCQYSVSRLSDEQLAFCQSHDNQQNVSLSEKNPYVVTDFSLNKLDSSVLDIQALSTLSPLSSSKLNAWFCNGDSFNLPKGDCFFAFNLPEPFFTTRNQIIRGIWVGMAQHALEQHMYLGQASGMHCHLYSQQTGLTLKTSGLSQFQFEFLKRAFHHIHEFEVDERSFSQVKQRQLHRYRNQLNSNPITLLFHHLSSYLQQDGISPEVRIDCLLDISFDEVKRIHQHITQAYGLDSLIYGHFRLDDTLSLSRWIETYSKERITSRPPRVGKIRSIQHLRRGVLPVYYDSDDTTVVVYFQPHSDSLTDTVTTFLLDQLLSNAFFNEIRAKRQLGYHVGCGYYPINQHPGLALYVQSSAASSDVIVEVIEQFLSTQSDLLTHLSDENFEKIRQSLGFQLDEKPMNASLKAQKLWVELGNGELQSRRQAKLVATVKTITKTQFVARAREILSPQDCASLILFTHAENKPFASFSGEIIT